MEYKKSNFLLIINLILAALFFYEVDAKAISNDNYLNFNNITINDGLSQGSVDDIFQDSDGYMWFSTNDGLNRFDGTDFKVLKGDNDDIQTIWPGLVSDVEEDLEGNLWVGTSGGLAIVDKKTFKATRFNAERGNNECISHSNVWDIFRDSNGTMWVATERGLNKYNSKTKEFTQFLVDDVSKKSGDNIAITSIEQDCDGKIVVSTKGGVRSVNQNGYYLEEYDKGMGLLNTKVVTDIFKDTSDDLWILEKDGEIYRFDCKKKQLILEDKISDEIIGRNISAKVINEDEEGGIWLGTSDGLYKYSKETSDFTLYLNEEYDIKTLVNNTILDIYRDNSGLMWIGTLNGISRVNPEQKFINYQKRFGVDNTLSGKSASGIYEDENGDLWIGTYSEGLNKLDRKTNLYTHYKNDSNAKNKITSNNVWQVTGDGKGHVWVATRDGLNKINIRTNEVKTYKKEVGNSNSLINNDIREVYIDNRGFVWIGTRGGLDVLNPETGEFTNLNYLLTNNGFNEVSVRRIFQDTDGSYYLAVGWSSGLVKLDVINNTFTKYNYKGEDGYKLSDNVIMGINEGRAGEIWIATSNGLNRLDTKTGEIKYYKENDGLGNSYVYGVLVDENYNIWMSTNGGISKFDVDNNSFENYTYIDGLQSNEFNALSDFKSESGEMFFGGVNGVTSFRPSEISKSTTTSLPVTISEFSAYNDKQYFDDKIKLTYDENNFKFKYILPDYRDPQNIKYEYMLEGFDKEWVCAGKNGEAVYTNILPGDYTFKVRAVLKGGGRSEEALAYVRVEKPWYLSNVALFIYLIIFILIIILAINHVKILDGLVKQRTLELNAEILAKDKLYEEKEELYKELLRYEKFRNTYLVNLSHELRTPLNVILSSQQLISALNKLEEGLDKIKLEKYMKIIKSNSENLLEVINDLIDSSKVKSGAYNLRFEKQDVVYIVEEVALSMKTLIENEGLELIIDPDIEEKEIMCAKTEIERCVRNLISNSVKFTESGGMIFIGIREVDNFVEIIVKDSGKGISKEDQRIIFDRFTQIEEGVSSKHFSSGIGLNLVKDLVELHSGTISINSELGKGSEFIIRIPCEMD